MGTVLDRSCAYTAGAPGPIDPGPNLDRLEDHRDPTESRLYFYDELDRLWKATDLSDAFGRRVRKTVGTLETLFFYDASGHTIETVSVAATADDLVKDAAFLEDELVGGVARWGDVGTVAEVVPLVGHRGVERFLGGAVEAIPLRVFVVTASGLVLLLLLPRRRRARAGAVLVAAIVVSPQVDCTTATPPQFFWVHGDHLGTPLAMTDTPATPASAKVVWRAKYEPFGKATVDQDSDGDTVLVTNDYRFPGQIYDYESGLHYNFRRVYDSAVGRYIEPDPIGVRGGINLYGYALADPLAHADPLGLAASDVEEIRRHIEAHIPDMPSVSTWRFDEMPNDASAYVDWLNEMVIDSRYAAECWTLDEFWTLYFDILHETMHTNDPTWVRIWDAVAESTANHESIHNRASYEQFGYDPRSWGANMWGYGPGDEVRPPVAGMVNDAYWNSRPCTCEKKDE